MNKYISALLFGLIAAISITSAEARVAAPADLYVATTGSNAADCLTSLTACATRAGAWDKLMKLYDLECGNITIHVADGVYTDSFTASGRPVGFCGFGTIVFQGNTAHPDNVLIKPSVGAGPAFQVGEVSFFVEGFKFDMSNSNFDTIITTNEGGIGFSKVIFGYNLFPRQDIQPGWRSEIFFYGDYAIDKPEIAVVASTTAGSNQLGLGNPAGVKPYMGIVGANIPIGCAVASIAGAWVTATCAAASTVGSESLTFLSGGQAHIQADPWVWVGYTYVTVTILGRPFYNLAWMANDAALFIMDGVTWAGLSGSPSRYTAHGGIFSPP